MSAATIPTTGWTKGFGFVDESTGSLGESNINYKVPQVNPRSARLADCGVGPTGAVPYLKPNERERVSQRR